MTDAARRTTRTLSACLLLGALGVAATAAAPAAAARPAAGAIPAAAAAPACQTWHAVASGGPARSTLSAVSAVSRTDVWAAGSRFVPARSASVGLIEHWNGTSWRTVPSPVPATKFGAPLDGIAALSARNAWAVGFYEGATSFRTLIEHWNGTRWSIVRSPNQGTGENVLTAVTAIGPRNIWAAGWQQHETSGSRRPLIEHWNGTRWSVVPSPSVRLDLGDNFLFGLTALSRSDIWAVGSDSVSFGSTLAMHWNGSAWSVRRTHNPGAGDRFFQAVTALSPRSVLAVGSYLGSGAGSPTRVLAERWNGSAWARVPAASPAANFDSLQGAATGGGSAWAVGWRRATLFGPYRTLAEHWNGSAWTVAPTPNPASGDDMLQAVAAVPHGGGFWAVGSKGPRTLAVFRC
jgi:hypothetical protein